MQSIVRFRTLLTVISDLSYLLTKVLNLNGKFPASWTLFTFVEVRRIAFSCDCDDFVCVYPLTGYRNRCINLQWLPADRKAETSSFVPQPRRPDAEQWPSCL